ncbi:MAG: ATP-dependent DNA ligase [Actinomycetota bacterium]|nr:ATP-dependent DNA ligase [Actinomycetota bacterium]
MVSPILLVRQSHRNRASLPKITARTREELALVSPGTLGIGISSPFQTPRRAPVSPSAGAAFGLPLITPGELWRVEECPSMALALTPPVLPQLARSAKTVPRGTQWSYEPKWDGFRALAFVDGADVYLQSRNGRPLRRYFPELGFPEGRYVIDGEIVIFGSDGQPDFDALGQRIHPADSRIRQLAQSTPARFIAFDVLSEDDELLLELPHHERRGRLERLIDAPLDLTPSTTDVSETEPWLHGAEGVIAKELDAPYRPGERAGMVKIKRVRTIDAVILGWRPGKEEGTVGSLILGLYDDSGRLREVGHTSGFTAKAKRELVDRLKPYETGERGSGEPSRWNNARDLEWVKLRPELVIEVAFDHTSNDRIRHGAKLLRWREDKDPQDCAMEQLLN